MFVVLKLYLLYIILKSDKIWLKLYIYSFTMGFICWVLDQVACSFVQPFQLHAWWHLCTSISILCGMMELLNDK